MPAAVRWCLLSAALAALASDWPQWRGRNRDNVWHVKGLPDQLPDKLEPRWKKPLGKGYGGIAVTGGRVYVMDRQTTLILNTPGELAMVELTPEGLKKLGKAPVIGKTWAHPAF